MNMKRFKSFSLSLIADKKLRTKLLLSYLLLIMVPLVLLALLSYNTLFGALTEETTYSARQSFEQAYSYLSYKLHNISYEAYRIAGNPTLRYTISKDPMEYADSNILLVNDTKAITSYLLEREVAENIKRVRLYVNDNLRLSSNNLGVCSIKDIENSIWFKNLSSSEDRSIWIPSVYLEGDRTYLASTDLLPKDTLSLGIKIIHPNNYAKDIGFLRCDFSKASILSILSNSNSISNSISYIVNEDKTLVASSMDKWDDKYLIDLGNASHSNAKWSYKTVAGENSLVGYRKIKDTNWYMVTIIPYGQITYKSHRIFYYLLVLTLIIVTIAYMMAFIISNSITKRVSNLAEKMNDLRGGKLSPMEPSNLRDEIGILIDDYNYMTERMSELIDYKYEAGQKLKSAELKMLQAQINPHFLYNTLDMINWYGKKSNSEEILTIINSLTKFYRLSLSRGEDTITIKDELQHVQSYFTIQNLRFQNKFNLIINVPDEILSFTILKITLQPLVENAILHGLMCKESKSGTIIISGSMENDIITLSIEDDGVGISPAELESIISGTTSQCQGGFGLRNVNDRIKVYYGEEFGLTYKSQEGKGTIVYIKIMAVI